PVWRDRPGHRRSAPVRSGLLRHRRTRHPLRRSGGIPGCWCHHYGDTMNCCRTMLTLVRCLAVVLLAVPLAVQARVELPLVFGDGAVLQRDQPMRVWGWSGPHARVQVRFDHDQVDVSADDEGRWSAVLPAHAAGGPFELSVRSGSDETVSHDLLVGDVYLASGQSNMEFELYKARDAAAE